MTRQDLIGCFRFSGLAWYDIVAHQFSRVSMKEVNSWTCYVNNDSDLFVLFRNLSVAP